MDDILNELIKEYKKAKIKDNTNESKYNGDVGTRDTIHRVGRSKTEIRTGRVPRDIQRYGKILKKGFSDTSNNVIKGLSCVVPTCGGSTNFALGVVDEEVLKAIGHKPHGDSYDILDDAWPITKCFRKDLKTLLNGGDFTFGHRVKGNLSTIRFLIGQMSFIWDESNHGTIFAHEDIDMESFGSYEVSTSTGKLHNLILSNQILPADDWELCNNSLVLIPPVIIEVLSKGKIEVLKERIDEPMCKILLQLYKTFVPSRIAGTIAKRPYV